MTLSDINPFIRFARKVLVPTSNEIFYSYDCRLFYLPKGKIILNCNGESHLLSDASLAMWQGGMPYSFQNETHNFGLMFDFDLTQKFSHLSNSLHTATQSSYIPSRTIPQERFEDCPQLDRVLILHNLPEHDARPLYTIISEFRDKKRFCDALPSSILKSIIIKAVRSALDINASSDTMKSVITYIGENYSRDISNADIAQNIHYHEYYLNKIVHKYTGMTLHQYLLEFRLQQSLELLINSDLPIAAISERCGFGSSSYFCRIFKQRFSESPLNYRRGFREF